jgi:hypothetical protein
MNKRVLLAGVLGAVAMFLWSAVAHMALPLGEAGIKQIPKEEALLSTMQSTLSEPGLYMFPNMAPGGDMAQQEQKMSKGPSGMLMYFPKRDFAFGQLLGVQFVTQLVQALIAVYLLSLTSLGTFGGRLGFFSIAGPDRRDSHQRPLLELVRLPGHLHGGIHVQRLDGIRLRGTGGGSHEGGRREVGGGITRAWRYLGYNPNMPCL